MKDSSHISLKKMQWFMAERYPLHTHCHGAESLRSLFEKCLTTLERDETPIAYCPVLKESPFQFDQYNQWFRPIVSHFATMKFL